MSEWRRIESAGGGRALVCAPLSSAGIRHVFTLRGAAGGGDEDEMRRDLVASIGIDPAKLLRPRQVHGSTIASPVPGGMSLVPPEADAVVVAGAGVAAAVATADCVGAILAVSGGRGFAVLHAGWRGVVAEIVGAAVAALGEATGTAPSGMVMALGPSARGCCYEVGEEVVVPFRQLFEGIDGARIFGQRQGRTTVDPAVAVAVQAVRAGLGPGAIHDAGMCTICRTDELWSWRRQREAAGRMWAAADIPAAARRVSPSASP
jgi:hypothetical protein